MTRAGTGDLVAAAQREHRAVAAFNVITLEHAEGIVAGADRHGTAVVLQLSQNAVRFHLDRPAPITLACSAIADAAAVPVALHLDHVTDVRLLAAAADLPFSSVMFDAGHLDHDTNIARTAAAASRAHDAGLWVEAELGFVGGKPDSPMSAHAAGVRTDPAEAAAYVDRTGVDALAVAVGSSHAMVTRTASVDAELVAALAAAIDVPLVLHGSSGVSAGSLRRGIAAGLVKINVGTALNVAMTGAVRAELADPDVIDPRRYLGAGRDAIADTVVEILRTIA